MTEWKDKLLIAEHPGTLRDDLVARVELDEIPVVVTDSSAELQRALTGEDPPRLVLVGDELKDGSGVDALYLASRLNKKRFNERASLIICRITDIRADAEMLELLRRRGVAHFIYRSDPSETSAHRLRDLYHGLQHCG